MDLKDIIKETLDAVGTTNGTSSSAEAHHLDNERAKMLMEEDALRLNHLQDEHNQKISLIRDLFGLSMTWIIVSILIVVYAGKGDLNLSDSVLITLITTTTAEVLGFFGIVLKYLYSNDGKPKFKENTTKQ